ncbi:MAG: hypothetical protein NVSMB66_6200 [Candidatus Doudnabacteria bacterium]
MDNAEEKEAYVEIPIWCEHCRYPKTLRLDWAIWFTIKPKKAVAV